MKLTEHPDAIPAIYGTFIFAGLLVYFLVMLAFGLVHVIELRLLNLLIMGTGIYFALRQFRRTHEERLNYFRALAVGVTTGFIGTSTFVLFLFFFMQIQKNFLNSVLSGEPMAPYMNTYTAAFAVWIEGIFSGLIMTFILTNWLRTDRV